MKPAIAFVGMTHLGLISGVAASEKGFQVICFDPDVDLINALEKGESHISEPKLIELMFKNRKRLCFTSDVRLIQNCDVIYVSPDISTNDKGDSDLKTIDQLLEIVFQNVDKKNVVVILSQVPPGFTRSKKRANQALYYQVETLIFGQAIERALYPERYIIGCSNPSEQLPIAYLEFLKAYDCPILPMRFESAELAKISINMCLAASITTANTLAELCEEIGADWAEIVPALRLDKRIGQYAYLSPGLGISGGNLERDLATVTSYANRYGTDDEVVRAWISNSQRRKNWIWTTFNKLDLNKKLIRKIGVLGLTYKENTHSLKNSPALVFLSQLEGWNVLAYDPMAAPNAAPSYVTRANSVLDVLRDADVLVLSTAWPEFRLINSNILLDSMKGRVVIDPYGLLDGASLKSHGFSYLTLGVFQ
jgi:UDPglucose 6-dehydrogenase